MAIYAYVKATSHLPIERAMAVTMDMHGVVVHVRPRLHRVMEERHMAIQDWIKDDLDVSDFPEVLKQGGTLETLIVVTEDERLLAVEFAEKFQLVIAAEQNVSEVENSVRWVNPLVPHLDEVLIHFFNVFKRTIAVPNDVLVVEVSVAGVEDHDTALITSSGSSTVVVHP
jgi:hypothetical protein